LKGRLVEWLQARQGAETYLAVPPIEWLPLHDACSPLALGQTALAASAIMGEIVQTLSHLGGRLLRLPPLELSYRDLLYAGCPLSLAASEAIAQTFVRLAFPATPRKKALITDLDGTLWKGIIGEDGVEGIRFGPDEDGWPFRVFQKFLAKLRSEGVLLAFCSKNNHSDVVPVLDSLKMPLRLSDFSAYRCNWESKSKNILSIAEELNIGCDAVVVIDDDQAELAEIQQRVPGISAYRTPREARDWQHLFCTLQDLFATWVVSQEDRRRADTIATNRARNAWQAMAQEEGSPAGRTDGLAHLNGMNLEVTIRCDAFCDPRSLELINKTNQFNLTGERLAQDQWLAWAATPAAFCWSARLQDRFGDFGTICVVTGQTREDGMVSVRQFVLSCRAFGRGVEAIMLGELMSWSGGKWIRGQFRATGRNEPARRFLAGLDCAVTADGEWCIDRATALKACQTVLDQAKATARIVPYPTDGKT